MEGGQRVMKTYKLKAKLRFDGKWVSFLSLILPGIHCASW